MKKIFTEVCKLSVELPATEITNDWFDLRHRNNLEYNRLNATTIMSSRTQKKFQPDRALQLKQHHQRLSGNEEFQISVMFYLTSWWTAVSKWARIVLQVLGWNLLVTTANAKNFIFNGSDHWKRVLCRDEYGRDELRQQSFKTTNISRLFAVISLRNSTGNRTDSLRYEIS